MDPRLAIMEAIVRRKVVQAYYNGSLTRLAPYMLFERNGELFTAGLNVDKLWRLEEHPRLGQLKLVGLSGVSLTSEVFEQSPAITLSTPRPTTLWF